MRLQSTAVNSDGSTTSFPDCELVILTLDPRMLEDPDSVRGSTHSYQDRLFKPLVLTDVVDHVTDHSFYTKATSQFHPGSIYNKYDLMLFWRRFCFILRVQMYSR